jgi:hypothetical protein
VIPLHLKALVGAGGIHPLARVIPGHSARINLFFFSSQRLVQLFKVLYFKGVRNRQVIASVPNVLPEFIEERPEKERDSYVSELTKFKLTDRVRAAALAAGVLPDDIEDVLTITSRRFKLGDKDEIVVLDKDGDPSSTNLDKSFTEEFKTAKPKFYGASGAGGSGAPAGGAGGGGGGAKTVKVAEFDKMSPQEQMAHVKSGGTVTD